MGKKSPKTEASQESADVALDESEPGGAGALARDEVGAAAGSAEAQAGGGFADRLRPDADPSNGKTVDAGITPGTPGLGEPEAADGAIPEKGASGEPAVSGQTVRGEGQLSAGENLAAVGSVGQASFSGSVPEATAEAIAAEGPAPVSTTGILAGRPLLVATAQEVPPTGEPAFLAGPLVDNIEVAQAAAEAVDDDFLVACVSRYRDPLDFRCVRAEDRFSCGVLIWTEPVPRRAVPNIPLLDYNQVREWA